MDLVDAFILGVVEGVTEFLPISSTGHLILVSDWLGLDQTTSHIAFEIVIQFAAIMAIFTSYLEKFHPRHALLWCKIFVSFLPIAIVGLAFKEQIPVLFENFLTVPVMFIIGGIVLMWIDDVHNYEPHPTSSIDDVTFRQAAYIGLAQVFALIPGTSRAGSTIVGAILVGLDRRTSAEFSFLLALPVLGATSVFQLVGNYSALVDTQIGNLAVGMIAAFIAAWMSMRFFVRYLESHKLAAFGVYRIIVGIVLMGFYAVA